MFKIVGTLPVKTPLPLVAWVLAGLVTLFSLGTSLIQVSGPMLQAAKPEAAHYASMSSIYSIFSGRSDAGWREQSFRLPSRSR